MEYECSIGFEAASPEALLSAINGSDEYERSSASVERDGNKVFIKIRAKDITALRASVNDYLRLLRVCESVLKVI